jgi:hypothetical protein
MAVTVTTRPDIPTLDEFVPGYEVFSVVALGAANNTPAKIIEGHNKEINAGLTDPKMKGAICRSYCSPARCHRVNW